jgi:hypothetical protein
MRNALVLVLSVLSVSVFTPSLCAQQSVTLTAQDGTKVFGTYYPAIRPFKQTRESAATFSVVRSGGACGSQGCGVAAFLSAQAGAERAGEGESSSRTNAGDPALDPAA